MDKPLVEIPRLVTAPPRAGGTSIRALNEAEASAAAQISRRLHAEIGGVVALLPPQERGASAMARGLGIDRATCQRIVSALAAPEAGPGTLVRLPGVLGLRQFLESMGKLGVLGAEQRESALAAVRRFEEFLDEVAGSQRRLRERLNAGEVAREGSWGASVGGDDPAVRAALAEAAARATGRWTETTLTLRIVRALPGDPRQTEEASIRGLIGHTARAQAVPLVLGHATSHAEGGLGESVYATLDRKPASGSTPSSLMPEFCTSPLPGVVSRNAGSRIVHMIDASPGAVARAMDIVIANREVKPEAHPATLRPAVGELWTLMTFPSRHLVFDAYLHRDLARKCLPSLETHLWNPDVGRQGATRWSTRFPGGPALRLLGPGLGGAGTSAYPRMGELTARLFAQMGWEPGEFVGYRCEVDFPLWRAGYCMVFDFSGNEM